MKIHSEVLHRPWVFEKMDKLEHGCVTTTNFSILVNSISGESFRLERSFRKTHISLHILIVSVKYLGRYIILWKMSRNLETLLN